MLKKTKVFSEELWFFFSFKNNVCLKRCTMLWSELLYSWVFFCVILNCMQIIEIIIDYSEHNKDKYIYVFNILWMIDNYNIWISHIKFLVNFMNMNHYNVWKFDLSPQCGYGTRCFWEWRNWEHTCIYICIYISIHIYINLYIYIFIYIHNMHVYRPGLRMRKHRPF